jgi:hypothetical protein
MRSRPARPAGGRPSMQKRPIMIMRATQKKMISYAVSITVVG